MNKKVSVLYLHYFWPLLWIAMFFSRAVLAQQAPAPVQLAQVYDQEDISTYLVSEKYDGFRAIWKNKQLRTRQGNIINAPAWFTQHLPDVWLDGELWYKRNEFEFVASTVTKIIPNDKQWQHIKYMVFDAPGYILPGKHKQAPLVHATFAQRAEYYTALITQIKQNHIQAVQQFTVKDNHTLMALLDKYTSNGAEGLMLQKANAYFASGRNGNLLKLKKYIDSEATVLEHLPGKGKYTNQMGSLLVEFTNDQGIAIDFKIGTGFSDAMRANPPAIGTTVTFAYHGFTKRGIPKFPSFIRVRSTP
jgi:DNA ligase-1